MQRFRVYDPPEYVDWTATPEVMEQYSSELGVDPRRRAVADALGRQSLLDLYRGLLRNRLHDVQLKRWVMQGVLSKAWLGTGEEAVTVGAVHALRRRVVAGGSAEVAGPETREQESGSYDACDIVGPMIRNAGACHEMGIPLADLFRAYLATPDIVLRGRDFHIGSLAQGIIAPISMVGSLVPVCAGIALAFKQARESRVALTWVGDGAARTGEFHEGMSMAAALGLPLIVILQNNQVALGTLFDVHSRVSLTDVARAYLKEAPQECHGNNVLDVYAATSIAAQQCREGRGPAIIVATTGRMGGHATHDEKQARSILPPEHFEYWGKRDPIGMYETYLIERLGRAAGEDEARAELAQLEAEVVSEIDAAAAAALESRDRVSVEGSSVSAGVYATASPPTPQSVDPNARAGTDGDEPHQQPSPDVLSKATE